MPINRRTLLATGSGITLAGLVPQIASGKKRHVDLVKDKDGVIDLPAKFTYEILSRTGDQMSDGYRTPAAPDGMAAFAGASNQVILMRNHEIDIGSKEGGAYAPGKAPPEAYESNQFGGVSRLVYDTAKRTLISHNLILTGTTRNCAGGKSPWGWLTCEEVFADRHGYVFLCDPNAAKVQPPKRIDAYGKFMHEAVAIDPQTNSAFLTEDRLDGCFYKFVPAAKDKPFAKGQFFALAIKGKKSFDTSAGVEVGQPLPVEWIKCQNQNPKDDTLRSDMQKLGAAKVCRGEGVWYHDGKIVFTATQGGAARLGQIWQYDLARDSLVLLFESTRKHELNMPDNITIHPTGSVFICEDGLTDEVPYLRIMNQKGEVLPFARNRKSTGEFAGICFSPDGKTMFCNMQKDGLTLAIHGPFGEFVKA